MRLDKRVSWIAAATLALALAPACGGKSNGGAPDANGGVKGAHHQYVLNQVLVPTNKTQSQQYGFDLNGDGMVDNHLGSIIGALSSVGGTSLNVQDTVNSEVDSGAIILLADLQATSLTTATGAGFQIYLGDMPSKPPCDNSMPPKCGQHLDGMTSFSIAPTSPMDALVAGNIVSGVFTGGPGKIALSLAVFPGSPPVNVTLIGARAEIDSISATGLMKGKIGGGISKDDLMNQVLPAVAKGISQSVAADCSTGGMDGGAGGGIDGGSGGGTDGGATCTCTPGSTGGQLYSVFDTNGDCMVTPQEVESNDLLQSALTTDVTINGTKAMSLGVGFTAVPATF